MVNTTSESNAPRAASLAPATGVVNVRDFVDLLRPAHWIKNVVVFAGPAAGLKLASAVAWGKASTAFAAFCLIASATYAINDVLDRSSDARHPTKRDRPVARGAISPAAALTVAAVLLAMALLAAVLVLDAGVTAVLLGYFLLSMTYSVALKRRVILDVIVIAIGFVLRAAAGSLAVGVETSAWLVACMFTLCLFMGFGKRRCEIAMIGDADEAGLHRRTLLRYSPDLLNHLISVSAGIAIITFLLYTLDTGAHPAPFPKQTLFYTLPLVIYGIFRFAMLTEAGLYSGPTEIVLHDRAMQATILLWTLAALAVAYHKPLIGALPSMSAAGS